MSNFNKVVTNIPVSLTETEMSNLSQTFSGIIQGGGGGGEGKRYIGDGVYVTVNNDANPGVISLTQTSLDKLNKEIPSAVSSFPDSVQYAKKTYVDSTFQTKEAMSAYATREWTTNGFVTDQDLYSTLQDYVDYPALNTRLLNKQDKLTFAYDNDKISAINGSALAGQGGTTYTPGQYIDITNDEISVTGVMALEEYSQYEPVLIGDSNITATSSKIDKHTQWNLAINSTPVVTDTKLVGENSITAHTTNVSGEWLVGLEQTAHNAIASIDGITTDVTTLKTASSTWDNVSAKLNTTDFNTYTATTAPSIYQPLGNYLSSNALEGYATSTLLDTISSKIENDIPTTIAQLTDSANYYKKSETSGATELSTEFAKYVTSSNVSTPDTDYVMTTTGWKVLTLPGGGMTQVIHDETLTGQGNANDNKLSVAWSALSGNTIDSAKSADVAMYYYDTVYNMPIGISTAINGIYNSLDNCLLTGDIMPDNGISGGYNSQAQTFELGLTQTVYNAVTSVSSKVDKPTSLADKYLVLRTDNAGNVSGWCDFQDQSYSKSEALGTFVATANIDTTTLSGGSSSSTKLGVKTDVIATRDYVSGNYLPTSGGTVSGQLVVSATSENFDSQFLKLIRDGVAGHARVGLGNSGPLALKVDDANNHTTQVNISPNTTNDQLVQIQHGGTTAYLIPAVTATTTDGLTNDGILHIILES